MTELTPGIHVNVTIPGALLQALADIPRTRRGGQSMAVLEYDGVRYGLQADQVSIVPVDAVPCPRCGQQLVPRGDGTLPYHEIQPGPRRSPGCRGSGKQVVSTDILAEDLEHEMSGAARLILDRALPGRGAD